MERVMTQMPDIHRLANGTIDYDFYRARAATLRAQRLHQAFPAPRGLARGIPIVAGVIGGLLLGLTVAPSAEQKPTASPVVASHSASALH
jgi:hypothetical protein